MRVFGLMCLAQFFYLLAILVHISGCQVPQSTTLTPVKSYHMKCLVLMGKFKDFTVCLSVLSAEIMDLSFLSQINLRLIGNFSAETQHCKNVFKNRS